MKTECLIYREEDNGHWRVDITIPRWLAEQIRAAYRINGVANISIARTGELEFPVEAQEIRLLIDIQPEGKPDGT